MSLNWLDLARLILYLNLFRLTTHRYLVILARIQINISSWCYPCVSLFLKTQMDFILLIWIFNCINNVFKPQSWNSPISSNSCWKLPWCCWRYVSSTYVLIKGILIFLVLHGNESTFNSCVSSKSFNERGLILRTVAWCGVNVKSIQGTMEP